jgi:glycosyltransferase involved in cell wall biosynthesis
MSTPGASRSSSRGGLPLVSVIVPVFNAEAFIVEALTSISAQTYANLELIVVDDGSTDGTPALLESFLSREPRMLRLHQDNQGGGAARNAAARKASGRYLALMDADDVAEPDRLAKQVAYLEDHPDIDVLGGAMTVISELGTSTGHKDRPTYAAEVRRQLEECIENPILDPTVMMRRETFETVGGYRPQFRTTYDYDLWLRMLPRRMCNLPDVLTRYRRHDQQTTRRGTALTLFSLHIAKASYLARQQGSVDPAEVWTGDIALELLEDVATDPYVTASLYAALLRLVEDDAPRGSDVHGVSRECLLDRLAEVDLRQADIGGDVFYLLRAAVSLARERRIAAGARLLTDVVRRYPRASYDAIELLVRHRSARLRARS